MSPSAVMIFAAGFGTRMGSLTEECPKPLLKVGGETLLDRTLALAHQAGIRRRVVNAHHLAEQIHAHLAQEDAIVSHETPNILDTGGGLKAALPHLPDPTFTANSDAVFRGPNPFTALAPNWSDQMEALLQVVPMSHAVGRRGGGDFSILPDGQLIRGDDYVYTGVQILRTARVAADPRDIFGLNDVWNAMAENGGLFGSVYPGHWCDVGHPEGLERAAAMLDCDDV